MATRSATYGATVLAEVCLRIEGVHKHLKETEFGALVDGHTLVDLKHTPTGVHPDSWSAIISRGRLATRVAGHVCQRQLDHLSVLIAGTKPLVRLVDGLLLRGPNAQNRHRPTLFVAFKVVGCPTDAMQRIVEYVLINRRPPDDTFTFDGKPWCNSMHNVPMAERVCATVSVLGLSSCVDATSMSFAEQLAQRARTISAEVCSDGHFAAQPSHAPSSGAPLHTLVVMPVCELLDTAVMGMGATNVPSPGTSQFGMQIWRTLVVATGIHLVAAAAGDLLAVPVEFARAACACFVRLWPRPVDRHCQLVNLVVRACESACISSHIDAALVTENVKRMSVHETIAMTTRFSEAIDAIECGSVDESSSSSSATTVHAARAARQSYTSKFGARSSTCSAAERRIAVARAQARAAESPAQQHATRTGTVLVTESMLLDEAQELIASQSPDFWRFDRVYTALRTHATHPLPLPVIVQYAVSRTQLENMPALADALDSPDPRLGASILRLHANGAFRLPPVGGAAAAADGLGAAAFGLDQRAFVGALREPVTNAPLDVMVAVTRMRLRLVSLPAHVWIEHPTDLGTRSDGYPLRECDNRLKATPGALSMVSVRQPLDDDSALVCFMSSRNVFHRIFANRHAAVPEHSTSNDSTSTMPPRDVRAARVMQLLFWLRLFLGVNIGAACVSDAVRCMFEMALLERDNFTEEVFRERLSSIALIAWTYGPPDVRARCTTVDALPALLFDLLGAELIARDHTRGNLSRTFACVDALPVPSEGECVQYGVTNIYQWFAATPFDSDESRSAANGGASARNQRQLVVRAFVRQRTACSIVASTMDGIYAVSPAAASAVSTTDIVTASTLYAAAAAPLPQRYQQPLIDTDVFRDYHPDLLPLVAEFNVQGAVTVPRSHDSAHTVRLTHPCSLLKHILRVQAVRVYTLDQSMAHEDLHAALDWFVIEQHARDIGMGVESVNPFDERASRDQKLRVWDLRKSISTARVESALEFMQRRDASFRSDRDQQLRVNREQSDRARFAAGADPRRTNTIEEACTHLLLSLWRRTGCVLFAMKLFEHRHTDVAISVTQELALVPSLDFSDVLSGVFRNAREFLALELKCHATFSDDDAHSITFHISARDILSLLDENHGVVLVHAMFAQTADEAHAAVADAAAAVVSHRTTGVFECAEHAAIPAMVVVLLLPSDAVLRTQLRAFCAAHDALASKNITFPRDPQRALPAWLLHGDGVDGSGAAATAASSAMPTSVMDVLQPRTHGTWLHSSLAAMHAQLAAAFAATPRSTLHELCESHAAIRSAEHRAENASSLPLTMYVTGARDADGQATEASAARAGVLDSQAADVQWILPDRTPINVQLKLAGDTAQAAVSVRRRPRSLASTQGEGRATPGGHNIAIQPDVDVLAIVWSREVRYEVNRTSPDKWCAAAHVYVRLLPVRAPQNRLLLRPAYDMPASVYAALEGLTIDVGVEARAAPNYAQHRDAALAYVAAARRLPPWSVEETFGCAAACDALDRDTVRDFSQTPKQLEELAKRTAAAAVADAHASRAATTLLEGRATFKSLVVGRR